MFNLPCEIDEVKTRYPNERQHAKAITFGVLYGAGPTKIAEQAGVSFEEAKKFIALYFRQAHILKSWIDENLSFIRQNAYTYSVFGRKRRLPESQATNKGVASHATRSGLNFLIQSVASDINLMSMIDLVDWVKFNEYEEFVKVFATVHDSIVAEVKDEYIDQYCNVLGSFIQTDRGVSIPGRPIGFDIEVGPNWGELHEYNGPS